MTTYRLELTLDDVIEVLSALVDQAERLRGRDVEFLQTLVKVQRQLVRQGADVDLINDIIETELPDVMN